MYAIPSGYSSVYECIELTIHTEYQGQILIKSQTGHRFGRQKKYTQKVTLILAYFL